MRKRHIHGLIVMGAITCIVFVLMPASVLAGPKTTQRAGKTNAVAVATQEVAAKPVEVPQSVFVVPSSPKEGRNPFFPKSMAMQPAVPEKVKAVTKKGLDPSAVVLNGLTGPPKRMAMINGRSFEAGESADVKVPGGAKLHIQCEEIRDDAVVVMIGNERRELRLKNSL